jgi:hypothetical protein
MQRQFSVFAGVSARDVSMLLALGLWLCATSPARAYEEQASLDLALGYAAIVEAAELQPHLGSADLGVSLGIRDFLVLRGALGYGLLLERKQKTQQAARARVELAYLIDVLRWVPFFGLGIGVWGVQRAAGFTFYPAGHGVLGLDWLVTRSWTLGVDVRLGMLLEAGKLRSWNEGQLRLGYMFDLF